MSFSVLMVCTGNICRSVMAEQILREAAADSGVDILVDSAGISDEEHGHGIDSRAARALREGGYRVPSHRARQVEAGELQRWDLILAMTSFAPLNDLRAAPIRRSVCSVISRRPPVSPLAGVTMMCPTPGTVIIPISRPRARPSKSALPRSSSMPWGA